MLKGMKPMMTLPTIKQYHLWQEGNAASLISIVWHDTKETEFFIIDNELLIEFNKDGLL